MNLNINNLLILGGTGFIGQSVYLVIRQEYPQLTIHVLLRSEEKSVHFKHDKTKVYIGTLETFNWEVLEERIDYIFHFARNSSSRGKRLGRYLASIKGWYGNRRVLRFMKQTKVDHLFYMSGSLMYGHHTSPVLEHQALNPISFAKEYWIAESPFIEEQKKKSYQSNISFIRVPWVLGNGSWFQAFFAATIKSHQVIPMYGEGNNMMSFILVSDIAKGLMHLLQETAFKPVYHLSYEKAMSQSEFVQQIKALTSYPIEQKELSKYERAIQDAFQCSIPLQPSYEFSFSKSDVYEKISEFLKEIL